MTGISQVVFGAPVSAVDEEDDGMRPFAGGNANVNKLIWVLAVRKAQIGARRFLFKDGFALHAKQYRTALWSAKSSRALRGNLAAKHAIDKNKVAEGQQHAKTPPDQAVRKRV